MFFVGVTFFLYIVFLTLSIKFIFCHLLGHIFFNFMNIFFSKKTHNPLPQLKLNGRSLLQFWNEVRVMEFM